MECVPVRMALSDMISDEEKLTGGFGPLRSIAGRIECLLLLDDIAAGELQQLGQSLISRVLGDFGQVMK